MNRAKSNSQKAVLGSPVSDVDYILSASKKCSDDADTCEIMTTFTDGIKTYEGFLFAPKSAKKAEQYWRHHIYADMTHVHNEVKGYLGAITTLNANNEM